MYEEFDGKVAIVTGGNSGIGKATARLFAEKGAKVVIAARNEEKGNATVNEIVKNGGEAIFVRTDVSRVEDVKNMMNVTVETFGGLDYAFNNAGIDGEQGIITECPEENWHEILDINLNGVFYCMKYEIQEMLKREKGAVVNNASVSGIRGYPTNPGYIASKHGVVGLSKAVAMEYARKGIRVNAVCPGLILTPMLEDRYNSDEQYREWVSRVQPNGRIGLPGEVAEAVLWLCSDAASMIVGHPLAVDGGILAR
jgi:NAD(P)-dependent dehydrogenase (short-subunit alcohol dehydrogenase family)